MPGIPSKPSRKTPPSQRRRDVDERKVDELVNKGGGVPSERRSSAKSQERVAVTFYLTAAQRDEVDRAAEADALASTRTAWLRAAVIERLERQKR